MQKEIKVCGVLKEKEREVLKDFGQTHGSREERPTSVVKCSNETNRALK